MNVRSSAFTLIELLVVISIIAVLASMLLPAIGMVKQSAQSAGCMSNQRQVMLAIVMYVDEREGLLPPSFESGRYYPYTDRLGQYLEIESTGSGAINTWKGSWKILKCASNTQSPWGISYGLNHQFCADAHHPTDPNIYTPKRANSFKRSPLIVISADDAGEGRLYIYAPLLLYTPLEAAPVWIGGSPLQPFIPTPRHRGGTNCGFLDGHVRWSPNLKIEDTAQTVLLRDNPSVH
jgi:prepilin-type N-terminal cleavage/methylation domain-containing protein/prepilin-type processing-associated H-X9-DG protein